MGEESKFTKSPEKHVHIPEAMSILPLRNSVFFPRQFMPLSVGRESTIKLIEDAGKTGELILIVAQKEPQIEKPTPNDIYHFGTVAKILKVYNLPDGSKSVFVQGLHRAKVLSFIQQEPYLRGLIQQVDDEGEIDIEAEALAVAIKNVFKKVVELSPKFYNFLP